MTIRFPGQRPARRARYALATLPMLLVPPAPASLAQEMPRASEGGSLGGARAVGEPTGIQGPTAEPPRGEGAPMAPPAAPTVPPLAAVPAVPAPDQDPPSRVGRVARTVGQVSYRVPGQEEWTPARLNLSVTDGTALYTQPNSRAAIEVNGSRIALDPGTDLQVTRLTEQGLQATLPQGNAFFRMRGMLPGETAEIVTPRGAFTIQGDGRYLVEAGDEQRPTRLSAFEGNAVARGEGFQTPIPAGQTLVLSGVGAPQGAWARAQPTALTAWAASMDGRAPMPAAVRQMTGAEAMLPYGRWDRNAQYGDIWYPTQVQPGWAPYRNGQWVWRDPWGWTWVDDQPWGYAPSHYGRWVNDGGRWGWVPQVVTEYDPGYAPPPRPYWAPALVSFIAGAAVGAMVAPVAWVPLAPYEPFLPWWRASPRYVGYVNTPYVRNVTVVNNYWVTNVWRGPAPGIGTPRPPIPGFGPPHHLRAATVVPGAVFTSGQRVLPAARPLPAGFVQAPAAVTPVFGTAPVRPVAQTPGLTPADARRMGLPVVPPAQRAPGPPPVQQAVLPASPPPGPGGQPPPPASPATGPGLGAAAIGAGVAAGAAAGIAAGVAGSRPGGAVPMVPPVQPVSPPAPRPGPAMPPAPGVATPGGKPPGAQPAGIVPPAPGARQPIPGAQPSVVPPPLPRPGTATPVPGSQPVPSPRPAPMPSMQPVPPPRPTPAPPTGAFQPPPQRFNPPPAAPPQGGFGGAGAPRTAPPPVFQPPPMQRAAPTPPPPVAAPPPRPVAAPPPPPPPPRPAAPPPQQRPQGVPPR